MIIGNFRGLIGSLTFVRDRITVNNAFLNELNAQITDRNLPANALITIAAREILHDSNYNLQLPGYRLLIVADEYDGNGGSIDVSGANGGNGAKGSDGQKGYASATPANCRDGKPGAPGGTGATGASATSLQLFCRRLKRLNVIARGGAGGNGGAGGKGGNGGSIVAMVDDGAGGKQPDYVGTAGGNGGRGGNAGTGGVGGQVTIRYMQRLASAPTVAVTGGTGGTGGAGGAGGQGFYGEPNGTAGAKGSNGVKGADGTSSVQQWNEATFWSQLRAALGTNRTATWAEYRTRMGEYYLRSFAPGRPDATLQYSLAANEFRSVSRLQPGDGKAQVMLASLASHVTPAGAPRDFYLTPNFPQYEQAFVDYAPLVVSMVNNAKDLLLHANNLGYTREKLIAELAHIQASALIVESERAEATAAKLQAEGAVQACDGRIAGIDAEIEAKRAELTEARLSLGQNFVVSVLEAIVAIGAVVGAVYTAGASLAALPGLLVAAQNKWGQLSTDDNGEVMLQGTYLSDWVEWKDGKAQVKPEIKALGAGMEKVVNSVRPAVNATLDLIDKAKVLGDIGQAQVDGELQSELKELLRRKAEMEFERAQARLGVRQTELRLATVELKAEQAQADLAAAQQMVDSLTADNKVLGRVTAMLMRRAQEYMTFLQRFQFWATRALDIYALTNYTSSMRFDTGFVHPDTEEDAYAVFSRGSSGKALSLMDAYLTSWAQLPGIIVLRNEYESCRMDLLTQTQFWTFGSNHPVTQQIRQRGYADFEIGLSEIYDGRFECKLDGVRIALSGATSSEPMINCTLTHRGTSSTLRLDGTPQQFEYPSRGCPVPAVKSSAQIDTAPPSAPEAFWGRSPAAKWRLAVQPDALQFADLSSLTEIAIAFSYKAFIPSMQSAHADARVAAMAQ